MTELKEIKSPPFAFLKISATTLAAHCQATQAYPQTKAYQRAAILPTQKNLICIMSDVHNKKTRSYNMSQIKGKNTKPEILVRKFLFTNGFRFRLYDSKLPGKPDIVLPKYKTVIFIHGCFWHGHENCKYFVIPKTRTKFWINKINRNKQLDNEHKKKLLSDNWKVLIIFECQLKKEKRDYTLNELINNIY